MAIEQNWGKIKTDFDLDNTKFLSARYIEGINHPANDRTWHTGKKFAFPFSDTFRTGFSVLGVGGRLLRSRDWSFPSIYTLR